MSKARAAGWAGYVDTEASYKALVERLQRDRVIPPAAPGGEAVGS